MDNLTHSLTGWALGQAGLKTKSRKGLAALILGANMPDLDVFFGHSCWIPLATHRGVTHSLLGGIIWLPPVLAGLLWLLDRWQVHRGAEFKSGLPMHFGWLVALCYIGAVTHPLLDLQTTYAVQLLSPFSTNWFHTESLFIIDLWVWIALGLAIWLSRRREKAGGDWIKPARAGLALVVGYIGVNLVLSAQAERQVVRAVPNLQPDAMFAGLGPLQFWKREVVWRQDGMIGRANWSPFAGVSDLSSPLPDNMRDPVVRAAAFSTDELRTFMRWSVMPVARVERVKCALRITFNDGRFGTGRIMGREVRNPFNHVVMVPQNGAGCEARAGAAAG